MVLVLVLAEVLDWGLLNCGNFCDGYWDLEVEVEVVIHDDVLDSLCMVNEEMNRYFLEL